MLRQIEPSSTPCSVSLIKPDDVHGVWHLALPLLEPAIEGTGGRLSNETVFSLLCSGQFQLWLVTDTATRCAGVTESTVYPTGLKVFRVLLLGGEDRNAWLHLWREVEEVAARIGCVKAEMVGRKGWARVLDGWTADKISMEKDLIQ